MKKILAIECIVLAICFILASFPVYQAQQLVNNDESHVIANVPYVSQKTDFYCQFACPTMVFKYYGLNTTLHEVLFNSGNGYGILYSPPYLKRVPVGSTGACKWYADRSFLADLYGLSYENYLGHENAPEAELWNKYWTRVKQNITNDIPIITNLNPAFLTSIRNSIRKELHISEGLWTRFSDRIWEAVPSNILHAILLVGFNETNGTVCYHDPAAALWKHPESGTYAWMNLTKFRKSIFRLSLYNPYQSYSIEIFTDTPETPIDKKTAFELAYERNVKKISGNLSAYDDHVVYDWGCTDLGINAVEALKKDMGMGVQHRLITAALYKYISVFHTYSLGFKLSRLVNITFPFVFNFTESTGLINDYDLIAIQKHNMSQYLYNLQYQINDTNISDICKRDAELLSFESENWTKLGCYFSRFLRWGVFMTLSFGILTIKKMENIVTDIISIEEEIIDFHILT